MWGTDTGDDITALGAHVSMPNHFHLLAKKLWRADFLSL